jgi:hypothetical protein
VKTEDMEMGKKSVCSKKSSTSPVSPSSAVPVLDAHNITATVPPSSTATSAAAPATGGPALYNPEIELSTDTEDSSSDVAGEAGKSLCSTMASNLAAVKPALTEVILCLI